MQLKRYNNRIVLYSYDLNENLAIQLLFSLKRQINVNNKLLLPLINHFFSVKTIII